jgi:hypothetical protein
MYVNVKNCTAEIKITHKMRHIHYVDLCLPDDVKALIEEMRQNTVPEV